MVNTMSNILLEIIKILKIPLAILSIYLAIYYTDIRILFKDFNNVMKESNIKEVETPYLRITYEQASELKNKLHEFSQTDNLTDKSNIAKDLSNSFYNIFGQQKEDECFEREFTKNELKSFFNLQDIDNSLPNNIKLKTEIYSLESCTKPMTYEKTLPKDSYINIIKSIKTDKDTYFIKFVPIL